MRHRANGLDSNRGICIAKSVVQTAGDLGAKRGIQYQSLGRLDQRLCRPPASQMAGAIQSGQQKINRLGMSQTGESLETLFLKMEVVLVTRHLYHRSDSAFVTAIAKRLQGLTLHLARRGIVEIVIQIIQFWIALPAKATDQGLHGAGPGKMGQRLDSLDANAPLRVFLKKIDQRVPGFCRMQAAERGRRLHPHLGIVVFEKGHEMANHLGIAVEIGHRPGDGATRRRIAHPRGKAANTHKITLCIHIGCFFHSLRLFNLLTCHIIACDVDDKATRKGKDRHA